MGASVTQDMPAGCCSFVPLRAGAIMQRFCLTLDLRPDPKLIEEYIERHRKVWPEVLESLRDSGVLDMQIYRLDERLFMVMDTSDDFTFERKAKMDQANPMVMRWEREMAKYQDADPGADASRKWQRMEKIFHLGASEV
jgi:L-rhamnose mutarotase